jgi:hypothetical protein
MAASVTERPVRIARAFGQASDVALESRRGAEQSGIDEVEDRPELAKVILDPCPGQAARTGTAGTP